MIPNYLLFGKTHWKFLLFGFVLMALSSFGQTFYISLFGAQLRSEYGLTHGGFGTVYAMATIISAFAFAIVGKWIDRIPLTHYTVGVASLLAGAYLLIASSHYVVLLLACMCCVRLGSGLMVHTALTTTTREYPVGRGKALGLVTLGLPLGEAILPFAAVSAMALLGWKVAWVCGAIVMLGGTFVALRFLPTTNTSVPAQHTFPEMGVARLNLWKDYRLLFTLPSIFASPFISTGFFFHQAQLVEEKHWSLQWVAACFVGYALARAFSLLLVGPLIDKLGATRVLPYFLVPQGIAMTVLAFFTSDIGVPVYLVSMGISSGITVTITTALLIEMYGPHQIAQVRSSLEATSIVVSGMAPIIMGQLIDFGMPLTTQAMVCLAGVVLVSCLACHARVKMVEKS